ncbi:MAG: ATP-dependent DNA helicase RecG [Micavibrio sp.]|nr:ATP-dependent DNA helicase RecG [Micavibrio sp.]
MSRPFELDPLFQPLTVLPGVGEKNAVLLSKLCGGGRVIDLLWHFPIDIIDRKACPPVRDAQQGQIITIKIMITQHIPNARKGQPYRVKATDSTGEITLAFFHAKKSWLEKQLPIGEERIVSGKIEMYQGNPQIIHPDIAQISERESLAIVEPVYPLTAGITNRTVRKAIEGAIKFVPTLPEWMNSDFLKGENMPAWEEAMRAVHSPQKLGDLLPEDINRKRLAYDELLANQLTLKIVRKEQNKKNGRSYPPSPTLKQKLLDALPYDLTNAQKKALGEIEQDMAEPKQMLRLLQGDVGAGKTVVAALSSFSALEAGHQVVLMAPTEILARQHADTIIPWMNQCGVRAVILTGRDKGKGRDLILDQIKTGKAQFIIGTHSVFQNDVEYQNLGLAIIDEQHRFGVEQRLALTNKNKCTDMLVMTATPIPRTLALTAYGDMDISILNEKPAGRKPIKTLLIKNESLADLIESLKNKLSEGSRVYWVCPLVEESEFSDMAAAEERYDVLKAIIGESVGLIHGRMPADEKDSVMNMFANGELNFLIATTVIEVGVNVPEATIMVIEHSERFGLSQLHQLRGRVGRGELESFCFLVYSSPLGITAKERLAVMRETEDGFVIAEKDLELRGSGDILGLKQSGMTDFKVADVKAHSSLLKVANDDAGHFLTIDNNFNGDRGKAIRTLLYLFSRDQAIQYLRSG